MSSRDSIYVGPLFIGVVIALMGAITSFAAHAKTEPSPTPAAAPAPSNFEATRRDMDSASQSPDFMRGIRRRAVETKGDFTKLPERGAFYKNSGGGRFADKTAARGIETARGRALGVAFRDFDGSGRPGFALANDERPGDLFQPRPGGKFANVADTSGTAYDRDGNVHGGMGLDWGDFDGDGPPDLFLATFFNEVKPLYRNTGGGTFTDVAFGAGIAAVSLPYVSFGCKFLDFDNDGNLDIAVANGHVQDNISQINPAARYKESALLFQNRGGQPVAFTEVSQSVGGPDFTHAIVRARSGDGRLRQ